MPKGRAETSQRRPSGSAGQAEGEIVVRRPVEGTPGLQGLPVLHGLSGESAGAKAVSMHLVVIPPKGAARAHWHDGHETAVYLRKGRVKTLYGDSLRKSAVNEAGDFLCIPPCLPHKPVNLSVVEDAVALVARTGPNEQESVVPYPERDDRSADR